MTDRTTAGTIAGWIAVFLYPAVTHGIDGSDTDDFFAGFMAHFDGADCPSSLDPALWQAGKDAGFYAAHLADGALN